MRLKSVSLFFTFLLSVSSLCLHAATIQTLSGAISSNTTLNSSVIYHVTGTVTVNSGVTLTIPAGTILKFDAFTGLTVNGTLYAVGSSISTIYFTSWKDDTVGGDSNGDGSATSPTKGSWLNILCGGSSIVDLEYCEARWGGSGTAGIYGNAPSSLIIKNNVISGSNTVGILASPLAAASTWDIRNNTIKDSTSYGMDLATNTNLSFTFSGNTIQNNTGGGLYVPFDLDITGNTFSSTSPNGNQNAVRLKIGAGTLTRDTTWQPPANSNKYYLEGSLTVPVGKTLTVSAGTIVKFKTGFGYGLSVLGTLVANGTSTSKIYFTSSKDASPEVGGAALWDTGAVAKNDWGSLYTSGGSIQLNYCEVRWGGGNAEVYAYTPASLTITNSVISSSNTEGIFAQALNAASTWNISNNTIKDCTSYGVDLINSVNLTATFTGNTIQNNTAGGLYMSPDFTINGNTFSSTSPNGNQNAVRVKGNTIINRDTTWQAPTNSNKYYLEATVTIAAGKTLTVASGTVVKIKKAGGYYIDVQGSLIATGTSSNKVYFTSSLDATAEVGGAALWDTGAVAKGDWASVYANVGATLQLDYCEVRWGGSSSASVVANSPLSFTVTNSVIASSNSLGVKGNPASTGSVWNINNNTVKDCISYGLDLTTSANLSITFTGNLIQNNTAGGLYISPDLTISGNTFSSTSPNGNQNAVRVRSQTLTQNATWQAPANANKYYLEGTVTVPVGKVLTIAAGTVIKFKTGGAYYLDVLGTLTATGTSASKIYFTSSLDTTAEVGGAALWDVGTVAKGNWQYVEADGGIVQLDYCELRWGGGSNGAIYGNSAKNLRVTNCVVSNSNTSGILTTSVQSFTLQNTTITTVTSHGINFYSASTGAYANVTGNTFSQNGGSGIYINNSVGNNYIYFAGNTSSSNSRYGVEVPGGSTSPVNCNLTSNTLGGGIFSAGAGDMRLCWWGNASGPSGIGPGTGASATGAIVFNPWRTASAAATPLVRSAVFDTDAFNPGATSGATALRMSALFDETSSWSITIKNSGGTTVRSYSGSGTFLNQSWDGRDGSGTVVTAGTYTVDWAVTSTPNPSRSETLRGTSVVSLAKAIARIDTPAPYSLIATGQSLSITGVVQAVSSGDVITSYDLAYGFGTEPSSWTTLQTTSYSGTGQANVSYNWPSVPSASSNSLTLRLQAKTASGVSKVTKVILGLICPSPLVNSVFSPNADGQFDTCTYSCSCGFLANWSLAIKDSGSSTVRSNSSTGLGSFQYVWDGKNASSVVVADGTYTLELTVTGPNNALIVSASAEVDDTVPQLTITSPSSGGTATGRYSVIGTATDSHFVNYVLEYGQGASPIAYVTIATSATQISNALLGVWDTYSLPTGTYTLRLRSVDSVANSGSTSIVIQVDRINFTNVTLTFTPEFCPATGESGTIAFTIDKAAQVTASVYPVSWSITQDSNYNYNASIIGSTAVRTFQTTLAGPGSSSFTWNGRTGPLGTDPLVADGCYLVSFTAVQTPLLGEYNPVYPATLGDAVNGGKVVSASGISVSPAPPQDFNPTAGIGMTLNYTLPTSAFALIQGNNTSNIRLGDVAVGVPRGAGTHADTWDGTYGPFNAYGTSGQYVPSGTYNMGIFFIQTPINSCIVNNKLTVTALSADQYRIMEVYDNVSQISYTLSRAATVTMNIRDPNGNIFRTLISNVSQSAGPQSVEWDGRDATGLIVQTEGNYKVEVQLSEAGTGLSANATTALQVYK